MIPPTRAGREIPASFFPPPPKNARVLGGYFIPYPHRV